MRIAVFLPNWLGDVVMATPTLRAIRRHWGREAFVAGIVRPNLAGLLDGTDWLDECWPFDPRAKDRPFGAWELARRMREARFDLALLLTNSLRTALLAWLGGARRRVGYARDLRGPLLSTALHPHREQNGLITPYPAVDTYLALAEAVGCWPESRRLELAVTGAESRLADRTWESLGLRSERVVLMNSSGAFGPSKLWPSRHFAQLAARVARETDHDVLFLCGPQERDRVRRTAAEAGHPRVFSLADQPLGLALSKACTSRGRVLVTTDSGPRHVAAALGVPVVTLFGPTLPVWTENPTVRGVDLLATLIVLAAAGGCVRSGIIAA